MARRPTKELVIPAEGEPIRHADGRLSVPDFPIIPFIEGDGVGPDIWRAARRVMDQAVDKSYGTDRHICWTQLYAEVQ